MPMPPQSEEWDKKYCYPGTNVLINKLGIKNQIVLNQAERELTSLRIYELEISPVKGNFDLKHLKEIHRYIFQDLYDWAGELRSVDISKGNVFCNFHYITNYADDINKKLQKDKYLLDLPKVKFSERLSYYFGEINALHPFREGNGRTQREFFKSLSYAAGYELDFANVSATEMIEASRKAFNCDYTNMERMINSISTSISLKDQKQFVEYIAKTNSALRKEFQQTLIENEPGH